ncbi:MAG: dual specificity protein phosphatase family protein [Nitrospiraceae bacterium]|nr:dual specificity protein phosphatase family protein [Nitrospiraceae bacterium]
MVTKQLLVGNAEDAANPPPQVGAVLMVAEEQHVTAPSWIVFAKVPLKEFGEATPNALLQAVEWVEAQISENRVMVCCRAGMGRSVSVVIAYLCCVEDMPYAEAAKLVLARRPGGLPLPRLQDTIEAAVRLRANRKPPISHA